LEVILVLNREDDARGGQARTIVDWRAAASLVSARWRTFADAEAPDRAIAFASYLAALDAEEAAAGLIASCYITPAV
jgi:hypothetical protein